MSKKLICLASFVLLLSMILTNSAEADLVGWWKFDEGSGTSAADSSGRGNDGTLEGSATWEAGNLGNGVYIEGSSWVEIPPAAWDPIEKHVTVAFWAYGGDAQPVDHFVFAAYSADDNAARQASGHIPWSNGNVYWDTGYDGSEYDRLFTALPSEFHKGAWVHWAFTKDGDTGEQSIYINGELFHSGTGYTRPMTGVNVFTIGCRGTGGRDQNYVGTIDDFRLYNRALSPEEIAIVMTGAGAGFPYALGPNPADGAMHEDTWINLAWRAGDFAVSHNVYLGDNFEDVNDGAGDTFRGNQDGVFYTAGFPGYAYPDGLVNGTTYYWRIDEVNDADPNSPWKGDVWSFWIQPQKAYEPSPADGVKYVLADATLNWAAGLGAQLHYVHFGDNFDDVNDAEGGQMLTDSTYSPGALEADKTYYWRVDEFAAPITHKGDVWSFTTVPDIEIANPDLLGWWTMDEGEGTTAVDWSGNNGHGSLIGDPQWVDGYQGSALEFSGSGQYVNCGDDTGVGATADFTLAAWAQMTPGNAGQYMGIGGKLMVSGGIYTGFGLVRHSSNVFRLWVGDDTDDLAKSAVSSDVTYTDTDWHHVVGVHEGRSNFLYVDGVKQAATTQIDFVPSEQFFHIGKQYSNTNERYFEGKIDDVRLYSKALTDAQIAEVMLGDTKLAGNPVPDSGALVDIRDISSLGFSAGDTAASHNVYLGTDRDAVAAATSDSPEFQGNQAGTSLSLAGLVEFGGGDYYWRVDEVEADETVIAGTIWKFTVPDYLLVDDFEAYNASNNEIWWSWKDGLGYAEHDNVPAYPGNGTGAAVGDETSSTYMEITIVQGGGKSMPLWYDNNKQGYAKYSEAELTLPADKRDWTVESVGELSLWFRGESANIAEPLYVAVADTAVVYHDDPNAAQLTRWTEWVIPLESLAGEGVTLTNVDRIAIGLGTRGNAITPGGAGKMYFDEIALYRPRGE